MPVTRIVFRAAGLVAAALAAAVSTPSTAFAYGDDKGEAAGQPSGKPNGGASGNQLSAEVTKSSIVITQSGGGGGSKPATGTLASVDPNWEPPACWYEPVLSPEELKAGVDKLKGTDKLAPVNSHLFWAYELFVNHYDKGQDDGYKNYNLGKRGMFWRDVVRAGHEDDLAAWDCDKVMFWQGAGTVPDVPNAPTPKVLAAYAYDKIRVPETEIELKPDTKSTVNLPTWVWLDKGTFKEVRVRAELPNTGLWAETTAKPVALHLNPGTGDAETYPASGDCTINDDGSIGTPYDKGDAKKTPSCGIRYLRATDGKPYNLKASITWQISWEGSGGAKDDLPDGTFETTRDMTVQEIQAINR
ncbi:hypothetical protein ACFY1L_09770 [Streptomyces sp. NPDC001663]|uniref:hypothetical protein n=1 Tax=Streptomyces sp. NPDC001663 TaxID=3364597 RepID=UPI0036AC569C